MRIVRRISGGRRVWDLDNEKFVLTVAEGGGHITGLALHDGPTMNPYWVPAWKTIEPWRYGPRDARRCASKLLASIGGHNVCLGMFGEPSADEARAGLGCHGEAPVSRWGLLRRRATRRRLRFVYGCELPAAQMRLIRTLATSRGSNVVWVKEEVTNRARPDVPYTMCEHVTFGPPFLEKGVTVFDMSAARGHTFPGVFGTPQRLKRDAPFVWPRGPGMTGPVDLRTFERRCRSSSDFSTQLMDARRAHAWFSAVNPRAGLLVAYVWRPEDFPWLGNWEENFGRQAQPWSGRSLARGMEFSNTPFPIGLRAAVDGGTFQGQRTYRWLPALGRVAVEYQIIACRVPTHCRGVADIRPCGSGFTLDLLL